MAMPETLTTRLALQLKSLRHASGWSLDQLASKSGISRATLSRLEQAKVSPTAEVLGKLCTSYALPLSRLMTMVEDSFDVLVPFDEQSESEDSQTGFVRRTVSPSAGSLLGEILECHLPPDTSIIDGRTTRPSQEHHLVLLDGALEVTVEGESYDLTAGDCLRYHLSGSSQFATKKERGARYLLVLI